MWTRFTILLAGLTLSLAALAGSPQYALGVNGLACPFCAYGIEKHLQKVEGVDAVEVDIKSGRVLVTMQENTSLTRERAENAIDRAGFTLESFEVIETQGDNDVDG